MQQQPTREINRISSSLTLGLLGLLLGGTVWRRKNMVISIRCMNLLAERVGVKLTIFSHSTSKKTESC